MTSEAAETQPAPASAFVPMAEGLGPQELYYCQVEAMLATPLSGPNDAIRWLKELGFEFPSAGNFSRGEMLFFRKNSSGPTSP